MKVLTALTAFLIAGASALPAAADSDAPCTTGSPVVTAGYTIKYTPATPTAALDGPGFQPEPTWGKQHFVATYVSDAALSRKHRSLVYSLLILDISQTYGVPSPIESGFAYAQFKCQYTCNGATPQGKSFYVQYGKFRIPFRPRRAGDYC
jgi:hypothetical protein